jgi:hypothetical protein
MLLARPGVLATSALRRDSTEALLSRAGGQVEGATVELISGREELHALGKDCALGVKTKNVLDTRGIVRRREENQEIVWVPKVNMESAHEGILE